jgi:hypothetical protein
MRVLRNRVFLLGSWIPAGTAESDLPDGAKIGNPKAWVDESVAAGGPVSGVPLDDSQGPPALVVPPPAPQPEPDKGSAGDTPVIPPQSGNGSAKANWVAYAESQNVDVSGCMNKAEIIATLEAAGIPTS